MIVQKTDSATGGQSRISLKADIRPLQYSAKG